MPGREAEFVRVFEPGVARRTFAEHGAQTWIGQHIGPWRRRGAALAKDDYVFAAVGRERAGAVVEMVVSADRGERPVVGSGFLRQA